MANIDGRGHIIFSALIDERGRTVLGQINDRGHLILGRTFSYMFTETLQISDTTIRTLTRSLIEPLHIADNVLRSLNKTLVEPVTITINKQVSLTRAYVQNVLLTVTMFRDSAITFVEHLTISDSYQVGLEFIESIHISDTTKKTVTRVFTETLTILDILITQVPFVMRLWNTKIDGSGQHSSLSPVKMISRVRSVVKASTIKQSKKNTKLTQSNTHTDVSLEDGRELR